MSSGKENCDKNYRKIEQDLTKQDDLENLSVLESLPILFRDDKSGKMSSMIPKIQQEMPNSSEFNVATNKTFDILMDMDVPVNLVPQILQGIESKDPIIANAWMETLISVIPILKENIIKHEILTCAISKSQLSKTTYFRVSSCKILGKLSIHRTMDPFEVKKDILPLVQSLCQDCLYEVRAAMCKELPNVAQGLHILGKNIIKSHLLPLLVELCSDENIYVRSAAIESVVAIIPYLFPDIVRTTIIPLVKNLCLHSDVEGDLTCTTISSNFNNLIINLHKYLSSDDAVWFMNYFNRLCKKGLRSNSAFNSDPAVAMLCRENCAQTLPTMAVMTLTHIPNELPSKWYMAFKDLTYDPCFIVRKSIALCLEDCIRILGSSCNLLILEFTKLLCDDDVEVLQILVPKIGNILKCFETLGILIRELPVQATVDVGRSLLKCFNTVFEINNWRMKESILIQLETLPFVMPSDYIHQHFTSIILDAILTGKAKPVRSQATRTLLIILRYNLKENQRKWIHENINEKICKSNCCYTRQMYVVLCQHAINIYSTKYFKEYFYGPLLTLAEDPISLVRLSMIKLCPQLKQMLLLPEDRSLQLRLEHVITKIELIESDKDVIDMFKMNLKQMRLVSDSRCDYFPDEYHRIEEEEKIANGKFLLVNYSKDLFSKRDIDRIDMMSNFSTVNRSSKLKNIPQQKIDYSEKMPFLDHHFYIDAGVSLPNNLRQDVVDINSPNVSFATSDLSLNFEKHLPIGDRQLLTDNNNRENDKHLDINNLLTSINLSKTTNITDDVKVNMKKISKRNISRSSDSAKVNRRCSCILENSQKIKENDSLLKRRSLNIIINDRSKIPISSKTFLSNENKHRSVSDQSLNATTQKTASNTNKIKTTKKVATGIPNEEKQNKLVHSSEKKNTNKIQHTSNLPLLVKRKLGK